MSYSYNSAGGAAAFIIWFILMIAIWVGFSWLMFWKVFEKAGKVPWKGLIPIYQFYVIIEIVGRPVWWFWVIVACYVGMLIPILNFIAWIPLFVMILLVALDMARCFGKSNGFGIGLWLLSVIFYPILGFGEARYLGPLAAAGPQAGGGYAEPMAPPPSAGQQYMPPTLGAAAPTLVPPPPLAQPVRPSPLTPPPAQAAPPTPPPAQSAPPTPPPAQAAAPAPPPAETTPSTSPPAEAAPPTTLPAEATAPTTPPAEPTPPESPAPPPPPPVT